MKKFVLKLFIGVSALFFLIGCNGGDHDSPIVETQLAAKSQKRIIIQSQSDLGPIASEVAKSGGHVVRSMEFIDALVANVPPQAIQGLKQRFPDIQIIEDKVVQLIEPIAAAPGGNGNGKKGKTSEQPPQSQPWGNLRIKSDLANSLSTGSGSLICVVDTGISKTHPDLVDNIVGGKNYVVSRGRIDSSRWGDDNGHGSHVAGTIAAVDNDIGSVGIAPDASLYAVKVLDRRGSGYFSDVTDGVYECVQAGADVINMSLGANGDPNQNTTFKQAVDYAESQGVVVVVAAGNESDNISGKIPAGFDSVVAVSATTSSDTLASFSNFGLNTKDFAAPGVSIYSTWKGSDYNTISGTSMASPHVAGVFALAISAGSIDLVAEDIGLPLSDQGSGLIDALATVENQ